MKKRKKMEQFTIVLKLLKLKQNINNINSKKTI